MAPFKFFLFLFLTILISPKIIYSQQSTMGRNVDQLSIFIASSRFEQIRKNLGEVPAIDSLFQESLRISNNNISDALVACTWACLTVKDATIVTPLLNFKLVIPFFSSANETFQKKNQNLPRYIFPDSPKSKWGDVDKLSHFFGSAFLEYNSFIPGVSKLFGYFIEVFEESFKIDSKFSGRDISVNSLGIKFGSDLRKKTGILPSKYLKLYKLEITE